MIVDGKAGPGTAGGDTIAKQIAGRHRNEGSRRWSCASTARADRCWHPNASARRCSPPRRRTFRSSCRWAMSPHRAAIGSRRPADFIFAEPSTITGSIGVFGVLPSFQGTLAQARHRRRRGQDHAAVGRAGPAQGPFARGRAADPDRRRIDLSPLPQHRRPVARTRRRSRSTRSPRAACGTAAPRASSAWSTASAG